MNINNGKTGTVNIPGALRSTGGDGDGQVGNVVAYAGDVYDENLNANQAEVNKSTIKLNEYNEVNVSYPTSEQMEGYILCNLVKNDEKILQDHSAWGSEFADYVRSKNLYIATNMGNTGLYFPEDGAFGGYIVGEEIANVTNSSNKSVVVSCFESASDYWILETETELTINDMPYYGLARYYQTRNFTPFSLEADGSLHLMGVGGYDGDESVAYQSQTLQQVLDDLEEQIASASTSGGVSSWNDLEDKPTILDSYDVRQIVLEKSPLHYDDSNDNYVSYFPNGSNDAYTPNTISGTSNSVLIGLYNGFRNTYNGVVLGNNNSTDGNKRDNGYDSTVIVGLKNTNNSKNSVLIGDSNNNNQDKSVMLGSTNINKSEGSVNIGYYNQNNGGERNVMIGYDNTSSNSASTICMGSENRFSMSYYDPSNQDIIAVGRGLYCSASGIVMGFYNVQDSVFEGDTANFLTIGDGSGNRYSATRSNIIEQRRNGDIFIKGIGNYNGNNSRRNVQDPYRGKSLQEVLNQLSTDIQSVSANTDTIINHHFTENNSIKIGTAINVSGTDSIAGGAGVSLTGNRAFGYGTSMGAIYLTGDEGTYSARLYSTSNYTNQNNIADAFATTHLNSYLLKTSDFSRVAQITAITYNGADLPLTITLDTDLGNLSNAVYGIENVAGTKSFNGGSFGNTGQNSSVIGLNNYNKGNYSSILGSINNNNGTYSTVLGYLGKNTGNYSSIIGSMNNNAAIYSNVIGLMNTNDSTGTYANIIGRNNTNKCSSTSIIGIGNTVNETTYPSVITGYENIADVATQQFTLGYGNHGTRGQYAEGNASASWMIGHHLTTSSGCWALGKYNKDYDVQDVPKQNFFVIGQGDTSAPLNSVELKRNGNLYIFNVGGFNGTNSDNANVKTLQDKITELENRIAQLESLINGGNS